MGMLGDSWVMVCAGSQRTTLQESLSAWPWGRVSLVCVAKLHSPGQLAHKLRRFFCLHLPFHFSTVGITDHTLCGSWGFNSGHQAFMTSTSHTEPSFWFPCILSGTTSGSIGRGTSWCEMLRPLEILNSIAEFILTVIPWYLCRTLAPGYLPGYQNPWELKDPYLYNSIAFAQNQCTSACILKYP